MLRIKSSYIKAITVTAAVLALLCFYVYITLFVDVSVVHAQTAFEQFGDASNLPQQSITVIIARVIRVFLGIIGIILTIMIIYAGYLYMTAQGMPEPMDKAKRILKQSVIGVIIILLSFSFTSWLIGRLIGGGDPSAIQVVSKPYSEPLKGSLGSGILNSHYPPVNAVDIPRNTKIFVEFKEPLDPDSIIKDFDSENYDPATDVVFIDPDAVKIFQTKDKQANGSISSFLDSSKVRVMFTEDKKIFVFQPQEYLGDGISNINYSVMLGSGIKKDDGSDAFTGIYSAGYEWTFTIGTEIDLTPPEVVSVVPVQDAVEPKNVTVEVTFSEAMDPIVTSGSFILGDANPEFTNVKVKEFGAIPPEVEGTYEISNAYKTVGFTTTDACGKDPCGDVIYCLPGNADITVVLKAADVDPDNIPQAKIFGALPNGLADAAGNSLDGNKDGKGCQDIVGVGIPDPNDPTSCPVSGLDGYSWSFTTTNELMTDVPKIESTAPEMGTGEISQTEPITALFDQIMKSSTVHTGSASLWPDPFPVEAQDTWWFMSGKNDATGKSRVSISHPTLHKDTEAGHKYYPLFTHDLKSKYQICMYPSQGVGVCDGSVPGNITNTASPNCCDANAQGAKCTPFSGEPFPINISD